MEPYVILPLFLALMAGALGVSSAIHHFRQRRHLETRFAIDQTSRTRIARLIGVEESIVSSVSVFDALYNVSMLDPHALRGIAHLHHAQEFNNLGDLLGFVKNNVLPSEKNPLTWRQIVHKYKGYTGEELAFDHLRDSGHGVSVPESGTEEGLDATIGGQPINVKITENPAYIQDHLQTYPHIPVLTNVEMHQSYADNPNVIIDPDLSAQDVFIRTEETLRGTGDLGDLIDTLPIITLAISSFKNAKRVYAGHKEVSTALEHIVYDTAAVGFGGWAGAEVGLALGLSLAPVTGGMSAIVVPAATTLLGTLVGVLSGKGMVEWFKQRHVRSAIERVKSAAAELHQCFLEGFETLLGNATGFYDKRVFEARRLYRQNEGFLKRTFFPSISSKFYRLTIVRLKKDWRGLINYYHGLHSIVDKAEQGEGGLIVYAQGRHALLRDRKLLEKYELVDTTLKGVEEERRKIN